MSLTSATSRVSLKNILFATDFSEPSESALPFALAIARQYGSKIVALHVLLPVTYGFAPPESAAMAADALEEHARTEMQCIESQLAGVPSEVHIERDLAVWPAISRFIEQKDIDVLVLGTHGRTGAQKVLMGSVAETIFRQSPVPVLTIGPRARRGLHGAAQFHRILLATDFTPESLAAVPYAVSLAQEHQAHLVMLHVAPLSGQNMARDGKPQSAAGILHDLHELIPADAELWCHPHTIVEYGEPAERILAAARERSADLIVLGVRGARGHLGAATHLERSTAHKVVAHADCPVLTVRG